MKPCDKCQKNVSQYIDEGQVTCFKTCKKLLEWKGISSNMPIPENCVILSSNKQEVS